MTSSWPTQLTVSSSGCARCSATPSISTTISSHFSRDHPRYNRLMRARTLLSAEEFDNYPFEEDKRYELDDGELIEMTRPAYQHNQALQNLLVELVLYFRKNPIGQALVSENLYALSPTTRSAPDVAVILGDHRAELREPRSSTLFPISPPRFSPPVRRPRGSIASSCNTSPLGSNKFGSSIPRTERWRFGPVQGSQNQRLLARIQ
jgi:hypothetical protein